MLFTVLHSIVRMCAGVAVKSDRLASIAQAWPRGELMPRLSTTDEFRRLLERMEQEQDEEKSPTLNELWPSYWETEAKHLTSSNRTDLAWRNMNKPTLSDGKSLGEHHAMTVNADLVEKLRALMHARITHRNKPPRNGTINRELEVLSRLLRWAHERGKIPHNPLPALTKEDERDGIRRTKIRDEEQLQKLLDGCKGDLRIRALILVLYDSMMRKMEVIGLRRDQVVRKPNGSAMVELGAINTKTGEPRRPRITRRALAALDALPNYGPHYFSRPDGRRYDHRYLYELYQRAVRASGLTPVEGEAITLHTLRHSSMYRRRGDGVPWVICKKQGGWKTDSAPKRYGVPDDEEMDHWYDKVVEPRIAEQSERHGPRRSEASPTDDDEVSGSDKEKKITTTT
jgi:integrase